LLTAALLVIILLVAAACGSDELDPNATPTRRPPDTVPAAARTQEPTPTSTTAAAPTATAAPATPGQPSGPVALQIGVNGEALEFDTGALSVPAGSQVVLTFANTSVVNQHNWVLVPTSTKDDVAAAGTAAGPDNDWVPVGDDRVLASTKLLAAGATGDVEFTAPPAGTYQFVCTFPGHSFTMFGDFEVTG
jgi:azurin